MSSPNFSASRHPHQQQHSRFPPQGLPPRSAPFHHPQQPQQQVNQQREIRESQSPRKQSYNAGDQSAPTTYLIASNPEVLQRLLRENTESLLNPAFYTTPASALNTIPVDFGHALPSSGSGSRSRGHQGVTSLPGSPFSSLTRRSSPRSPRRGRTGDGTGRMHVNAFRSASQVNDVEDPRQI